jgi:hypothetical protein
MWMFLIPRPQINRYSAKDCCDVTEAVSPAVVSPAATTTAMADSGTVTSALEAGVIGMAVDVAAAAEAGCWGAGVSMLNALGAELPAVLLALAVAVVVVMVVTVVVPRGRSLVTAPKPLSFASECACMRR